MFSEFNQCDHRLGFVARERKPQHAGVRPVTNVLVRCFVFERMKMLSLSESSPVEDPPPRHTANSFTPTAGKIMLLLVARC